MLQAALNSRPGAKEVGRYGVSFRVGDKKSEREDDLLDTFCYGIALALGDHAGF